jgi:Tfp pilus assembly protein PilX
MAKLNNERGVAILFTLFFIIVLSGLGASFVLRSITETRVARKHELSTQAFWLADAGLNRGVWNIINSSCTGFVQCGTSTACTSCTGCGSGDKCMAGSLSTGDYDATLNAANTLLTSVGSYPSRTASGRVTRTVQISVAGSYIFGHAAFAEDTLSIANNALIDSWNSSQGTYAETHANNGDVGTNGTTTGNVNLGENADVRGDVSTYGGTVTVDNNASVSGTVSQATGQLNTLSVVSPPSALSSLATNPDSTATSATKSVGNNGSATLTAGDWKFAAVTLANNATLNIDGDVNLYLTGSSALTTNNNVIINVSAGSSLTLYTAGAITLGNNSSINNVSKTPSNLQIYSGYTGTTGITLSNNGSIYGAIHAPLTGVSITNNMDIYGAVVGKTIALDQNANIHYDEALQSIQGSGNFTTSNWQEP